MVDAAKAVYLLFERLVIIAVQHPVDGLGKHAEPVTAEMNVGFLAGNQQKIIAGQACEFRMHDIQLRQAFSGIQIRCTRVMKFGHVYHVHAHALEKVDEVRVLQTPGNATGVLLPLLIDKIQRMFVMVVTGQGLVAGQRFETVVARVAFHHFQVLVACEFRNK